MALYRVTHVTIYDMLQSFDRKQQLDIAILDFSKAFDTVPHDRLLHKLNNYGIRGPLHAWLTTFLTKRKMRVSLEGEFSNEATVKSGVRTTRDSARTHTFPLSH